MAGRLRLPDAARLSAALLLAMVCMPAIGRTIPPYERGKGKYQWILTEWERERGISYAGTQDRLRTKMKALSEGTPIKVAFVGGSITMGNGAQDGFSWPIYFENYMIDHFGADKVSTQNSAVGGTGSAYMVVCHNMHVPKDADIIFIEYAVNEDANMEPTGRHRMNFEQMTRKFLNYPRQPAVALVHLYAFDRGGHFWGTAETHLTEIGLYYNLPQVSVRGCCYSLMAANETGFMKVARADNPMAHKNVAFFWDAAHPDGLTGHRVTAELAINLMLKALNSLQREPLTPEQVAAAAAPNPQPMIPGNHESQVDRCFIGSQFQNSVHSADAAWEWTNEGRKNKWGYLSTTPGSVIRLKVDTRSFSTTPDVDHSGPNMVEIAHLRSYEHMGQASVKCESGCTCGDQVVENHIAERHSQLHMHSFGATQAAECIIAVTVLNTTSSGEHKVKLAGIMVVEKGTVDTDQWGQLHDGAVMAVHELTAAAGNGSTYNIGSGRNWRRRQSQRHRQRQRQRHR